MPLTIAIDGPVGAGKSTISDAVAQRLGILHLDTGAMYRAVGLCALEKGINLQDEAAVSSMCENGEAQVSVQYENGAQRRMLQLREKGDTTPFETILAEVNARDYQDMHRETDPLRKADDAILVDSSDFSFDETVNVILVLVKARQ